MQSAVSAALLEMTEKPLHELDCRPIHHSVQNKVMWLGAPQVQILDDEHSKHLRSLLCPSTRYRVQPTMKSHISGLSGKLEILRRYAATLAFIKPLPV